uniref:Uncharacterized protein LOC111124970 isoform X1 n=1 Tax=Crassostrea virginica TaxID=6565 RepID=A0A8B8D7D6_CRAVI|nr:uncharacterized protein LOC111124970 isoform X1 [Crassostrea virginica]
MKTFIAFLFSILSISVVLSCTINSDCRSSHCHLHAGCFSGQCKCVDCIRNSNCPHCLSGHPYCSHHSWTCHCEECTTDEHCLCPGGVRGHCNRNHHDHKLYCHCPAAPTTTTSTTTTTQPLVPLDCSNKKISVIESIAENLHVEDDRAGLCPGTNKHQTSEALVIHKCNATARSSWSKGVSVQHECSKNTIQAYTPISTFYDSVNNTAGFFIDCTDNDDGIKLKMAAQTCSDAPKIMELNETTNPKIADFFTIFQQI